MGTHKDEKILLKVDPERMKMPTLIINQETTGTAGIPADSLLQSFHFLLNGSGIRRWCTEVRQRLERFSNDTARRRFSLVA